MLNPKIKIAIAGVGTVGKGLIDLLLKYKNKQTKMKLQQLLVEENKNLKGNFQKYCFF